MFQFLSTIINTVINRQQKSLDLLLEKILDECDAMFTPVVEADVFKRSVIIYCANVERNVKTNKPIPPINVVVLYLKPIIK
jgi:hypothetical protein